MQVIGSHRGTIQGTYGPGDGIVIGAGTTQGLQVGQDYFVRRLQPRSSEFRVRGVQPLGLHTAGWVRISAVQPETAIAEIVHACEGLQQGDYLEPFSAPRNPAAVGGLEADYSQVALVLFGGEGKRTVGPGEMILIDRGLDDGIVAGQRMTVFRNHFGSGGPVTNVAEAIAVEPMPQTTMIRVEEARDAVFSGDRVALHPMR